ncbi:MAG: hypothetical protein ACJ76P_14325 [Actinomycetota bacterium]
MRRLRSLLPLSIALFVTLPLTQASAQAPVKEHFVDQGIFTLPDIDCGSFSLHEDLVSEDVTMTTFFDNAGNAVKVATKANLDAVIHKSGTTDTFRDHSVFTETDDLVNGTTTISGPSYHYKVPGKGEVFAEVGHQIFVTDTGDITFQSGKDDFTQQDLQGICDAFA